MKRLLTTLLMSGVVAGIALAQDAPGGASQADQAAELAKQLQNPVASLISVPFQNNFDFGWGPDDDGFRYTMNFQPVVRSR